MKLRSRRASEFRSRLQVFLKLDCAQCKLCIIFAQYNLVTYSSVISSKLAGTKISFKTWNINKRNHVVIISPLQTWREVAFLVSKANLECVKHPWRKTKNQLSQCFFKDNYFLTLLRKFWNGWSYSGSQKWKFLKLESQQEVHLNNFGLFQMQFCSIKRIIVLTMNIIESQIQTSPTISSTSNKDFRCFGIPCQKCTRYVWIYQKNKTMWLNAMMPTRYRVQRRTLRVGKHICRRAKRQLSIDKHSKITVFYSSLHVFSGPLGTPLMWSS